MSLVSNFIGGISSIGINNQNNTQNFDLTDNTFSDLLKNQMNVETNEESNNIFASLGVPAGLQIENVDFPNKIQDSIEHKSDNINQEKINEVKTLNLNNEKNITTSEAVTFFTSLLNNSNFNSDNHSQLYDFAKKQASNFYNKYSRSVVTDVQEFVKRVI